MLPPLTVVPPWLAVVVVIIVCLCGGICCPETLSLSSLSILPLAVWIDIVVVCPCGSTGCPGTTMTTMSVPVPAAQIVVVVMVALQHVCVHAGAGGVASRGHGWSCHSMHACWHWVLSPCQWWLWLHRTMCAEAGAVVVVKLVVVVGLQCVRIRMLSRLG